MPFQALARWFTSSIVTLLVLTLYISAYLGANWQQHGEDRGTSEHKRIAALVVENFVVKGRGTLLGSNNVRIETLERQ